jgi:predicted dehydrogenase
MEKTYRAALIGCGNIGAGVERYADKIQPWTHAGAYHENPRIELVALVDTDASKREKAKQHFPEAATFLNVKEMMEQAKPDIVSIATPSGTHAPVLMEVVPFGPKAVVCEKPIAYTSEDAEQMIAACRERNILLFINHIRRFDPLIRQAKERMKDIGEVLQANGRYTRGLFNNGTHLIDLLRFFLGEVVEVTAVRNRRTETYTDLKDDINADGFLFFASGARAAIQSYDSNDYSIFDYDFYGRSGRILLTHFGFDVEVTGVKPCSAFIGHRELDVRHPEISGGIRSFTAPMVQHVVDCLDGKDTPVGTGEDGLAALKILNALKASAEQEGKRVTL